METSNQPATLAPDQQLNLWTTTKNPGAATTHGQLCPDPLQTTTDLLALNTAIEAAHAREISAKIDAPRNS